MGILDAPALTRRIRRAVYLTGAPGTESTLATDASGKGVYRIPVRLPCATTRWRFKVRSYDPVNAAAGPALNLAGAAFGAMAPPNSSNVEAGTYLGGTSTMVVPASPTQAIPTDGTWYTSPWVTATATQFAACDEYLLSVGYDTGTGAAVSGLPRGIGISWRVEGDPATTNGFTTGTPALLASTPLEYAIEYESADIDRIVLFIGDSITAGVGGGGAAAGQPRYRAWPDMWGVRTRIGVINLGVSGSLSGNWLTPAAPRYTRFDSTGITIDAAYIGLGSNDASGASPTALATYQSNMATVIGNARTIIGAGKPIYLGNVTPRGLDNVTAVGTDNVTKEAQRLRYNSWLEQGPRYTQGTINFDEVVRDPANNAVLLAKYAATASATEPHMSKQGYNMMQLAIGRL